MRLSRRQFLLTASAAAIAPTLPALPAPVHVGLDLASGPDLARVAFAAGTSGEFDWQVFFAPSLEEAKRQAARYFGFHEEEGPPSYFEIERIEKWDHRGDADAVTGADWIRAGMGHICGRCSGETFADCGANVVDEEVVCEDCMTFADWMQIDDEHVEDELANRIYDEGAAAVEAWLAEKGHWATLKPEIWVKALARAAEE